MRLGKVRYVGASNYDAWRLARALWESDKRELARYDSLQPHYNLAHRDEYERELEPLCREQGVGVIPYSPLAGGFLSGKYRAGRDLPCGPGPAVQRAGLGHRGSLHERAGFAVLEAVDRVARARDATVAQAALAWLLARPGVTTPIIGANGVDQLRNTLGTIDLTLAPDEIAALDEASDWRPQG